MPDMDTPLQFFDNMTLMGKVGDCVFMLFAYPCVMVYFFWFGDGSGSRTGEGVRRVKRIEKSMRVAMEKRKKVEPSALPPVCANISSAPQSKYWKSQSPQQLKQQSNTTSRLLSLPLEIREQIYSEVLSQQTFHITQLPRRLGHQRCTSPTTNHTHNNIICGRECFNPSEPAQTYRYGEALNMNGQSDNSLALLQSCRQIYHESSHLLYQTNTFDINHPQTLIFLARTLRPSRLASIRRLNLTWSGVLPFIERDTTKAPDDLTTWEDAWRIIGEEMIGLRVLKLRLLVYDDEVEKSRSGPFLQHARKRWCTNGLQFEKILGVMKERVRGLREFRLGVELPEVVEWDVAELEGRLREVVCAPRVISR